MTESSFSSDNFFVFDFVDETAVEEFGFTESFFRRDLGRARGRGCTRTNFPPMVTCSDPLDTDDVDELSEELLLLLLLLSLSLDDEPTRTVKKSDGFFLSTNHVHNSLRNTRVP